MKKRILNIYVKHKIKHDYVAIAIGSDYCHKKFSQWSEYASVGQTFFRSTPRLSTTKKSR